MKIVIADDHPLVRDALARTVRMLEPGAEVIECDGLEQAEGVLADQAPAMALLDLHMPGMQGVDSVRQLRARHPGVLLVVASGDDQPAVIRSAISAGAAGFLPKSERPEVLRQAIRLVLDGGTYVPSRALEDVGSPPPASRPDTAGLTPRQLDVLRCLMRGEPKATLNKSTADDVDALNTDEATDPCRSRRPRGRIRAISQSDQARRVPGHDE